MMMRMMDLYFHSVNFLTLYAYALSLKCFVNLISAALNKKKTSFVNYALKFLISFVYKKMFAIYLSLPKIPKNLETKPHEPAFFSVSVV